MKQKKQRKKFYKKVKVKDLCKPIFYWAKKHGKRMFRYITTHVPYVTRRGKFYDKVKFKDEESKKYLCKQIFHWAKKNEMKMFRYITNYVSYATVNSEKFNFNVRYPITISGRSLLDICIEDANKNIYHIALIPEQIIYFEREEGKIEIFCAKTLYEGEERETFYSKKISYTIEE